MASVPLKSIFMLPVAPPSHRYFKFIVDFVMVAQFPATDACIWIVIKVEVQLGKQKPVILTENII